MLGRSRAQRNVDRALRLVRDYSRQLEFLEDRQRWKKPERRVLGDLLDRDEELRAMFEAPSPTTEDELRQLLAVRRRVRSLIADEAADELRRGRASEVAAVLAETDRLIARLGRLPFPELVTVFERHREALEGFYAAYDQADDEATVEAWRRADATAKAAEEATVLATGPAGRRP